MHTLFEALAEIFRQRGQTINFGNADGSLKDVRYDEPLPKDFVLPTQDEVGAALARLANPVPHSIANWKGRAILIIHDLFDKVAAALAMIPDDKTRKMAQIAFDSADFTRNSPTLNAILDGLGLDEAAKDALFIDGDKLEL